MAANTAYADFPRLAALQAGDGFLPRQLTYRGSRLVFSRGIVVLARRRLAADRASSTPASPALIPLYAIGVFLSFTLSQAGMARRWWKSGRLARRRRSSSETRLGRCATTRAGGSRWSSTRIGRRCHRRRDGGLRGHQVPRRRLGRDPGDPGAGGGLLRDPPPLPGRSRGSSRSRTSAPPPRVDRHRVILPISGVHRGIVAALRYARALSDDVTAVYVSTDPEQTAAVQKKWGLWGDGVRLVVAELALPAAARAARRLHQGDRGARASRTR